MIRWILAILIGTLLSSLVEIIFGVDPTLAEAIEVTAITFIVLEIAGQR